MVEVTIIGAGTVGQANGIGLMAKGHGVTFVDADPKIIHILRSKNLNAFHVNEIYNTSINDNFESSISVFCVPTPFTVQNKNHVTSRRANGTHNYWCNSIKGHTDLSNVISSVSIHAKWLRSSRERMTRNGRKRRISIKHHHFPYHHLVVIRSTVPPGTTRKVLVPLIQSYSGMNIGEEIGICMQPEFLRTSSSLSDFKNPRAIVIGEFDTMSGDILESLYADFKGQLFRTNVETAEFMKYVQNSFNATKISFANEMWMLGQKLGLDANVALRIASAAGEGFWNPAYGITGGRPYDGACLPKDVKGFLNFAKEHGFDMSLLSAVDAVNSDMNKIQRTNKHKKKEERLIMKRDKPIPANKFA